ncbi:MAG: Franean1_4349 family RiPP [Anaerolineae bacterium]|jgi:hypothetical protein
MSKEAVQAVIGKAVMETEFRELLFANPEEALEGYELTDTEVAALKAIDAETMESFAGELDERISRMLIAGAGFGDAGLGADQAILSRRLGGPIE